LTLRVDPPGASPARPSLLHRRAPALGRRNYRIFFITQLVSQAGTWMQTLGQAWLIVVLTRDPLILGLVTVAQAFPVLVFSLLGGVAADRFDKRHILLITPTVSAVLAAALGLLCISGTVQVWQIAVLAFLLGTVKSIEIPVRQSFVVEMVGPDLLPSAVGLNSASYQGARLVGPAVAGVVIGLTTGLVGGDVEGTGVAFLLNAGTFGVVVAGFLLMRPDELMPPARRTVVHRGPRAVFHQIGEGIAHVRHDRPLLVTMLVPGLISTLAINFGVLIPVLALEYDLDSSRLGLLMAANGVGALLGALRIGMGGDAGANALIRGTLVLGGALVLAGIVTALSIPLLVTALLLFVAGAGAVTMRTATNTSVQLATPPEVRGRVMSVFALVFEGISPMGALIIGAVASALGGPAAFAACGSAAVILVLGRPDGGGTSDARLTRVAFPPRRGRR
jgi:MFS family permease